MDSSQSLFQQSEKLTLAGYHPTFKALFKKLADPAFSVRDCTSERIDWVKAGCPIYLFDTDPDPC